MRIVEAELELVPATERLVEIVLAGRVRLVPIAVADDIGREVPVDNAGRVVGERLLVPAVLIRWEQDLVEAESRVEEEP